MANIVSRTAFVAAALAVPTAVMAQDQEQRVQVIGAMQDQEQRVQVIGAMQDQEQRVQVIGAAQDQEQRVQVIGAANGPGNAQPAEDPADKAIPEIPIVYEEDDASSAGVEDGARPAPDPGL